MLETKNHLSEAGKRKKNKRFCFKASKNNKMFQNIFIYLLKKYLTEKNNT